MTIAGAVLCFGLRFMAIRRGWRLPIAGGTQQAAKPTSKNGEDDHTRRL